MIFLLALLGCAADDKTVTLEWHEQTVQCVSASADWTPPDGVVAVSLQTIGTTSAGSDYVGWSGGYSTVDGTMAIPCQDDILVLYAIEQ